MEHVHSNDIDRVETLAKGVNTFSKTGFTIDMLYKLHCEEVALSLADLTTIHGVDKITKLLSAIIDAIKVTNADQMHEAFLMALDMELSLDDEKV